MRSIRRWLQAAIVAAAAMIFIFQLSCSLAAAQGNLRIGLTGTELPLTWGQPDDGLEGFGFMGLLLYDGLTNWDTTATDTTAGLVPGLAESWEVDQADNTRWTFKLRAGVKFHDGSDFNADAVVFNMDRLFDDKAPQYSARMAALTGFRIPAYKSVRKIDDTTVEFTTKYPDATWPYQLSFILMASPKQWEAAGKDWSKFGQTPSGTGAWRLSSFKMHEAAELIPNKEYWDGARVPRLDKLTLVPIPDLGARSSALLAGQVDWIEAPSPEALKRIQAGQFNIISNIYPNVWAWQFSRLEGSPWNDIRVRKAVNLAIDRKGIVDLMGGNALQASGHVLKGNAWYGAPTFEIKTDVEEAKRLLAAAGYEPQKPLKVKMLISSSGAGLMMPLAINEHIQQSLKAVNVEVSFEVVDWQGLLDLWRAGAKAPQARGANGVNLAYATQDPFSAFIRLLRSDLAGPVGVNFGHFSDPEMDALLAQAQATFDNEKRDELLAKVHTKMVDEALFLWVAHDMGPRAMSTKVKGFVPARSWFQNLSSVWIESTASR